MRARPLVMTPVVFSGGYEVSGLVCVDLALGRRILLPRVGCRGSLVKRLENLLIVFILRVYDLLVLHV